MAPAVADGLAVLWTKTIGTLAVGREITLQACGGWVARRGSATVLLTAVWGGIRLYQYFNQGDSRAGTVNIVVFVFHSFRRASQASVNYQLFLLQPACLNSRYF